MLSVLWIFGWPLGLLQSNHLGKEQVLRTNGSSGKDGS